MKEIIEERLKNSLSPSYLMVVDESHKHFGHKAYQAGAKHFAIYISSPFLTSLSRLAAHRKIYETLSDFMPMPIHALRIEIKSSS